MGMYTELVCAFRLKPETPEAIVRILEKMCVGAGDEIDPELLPDHPLFRTERWSRMLISDSAYFPGDTNSTIQQDIPCGYVVTIRCNLKNYDGEIEHFLDWIGPYIDAGTYPDFIGYKRHEQSDVPTLIYVQAGKIRYVHVRPDIEFDGEEINQ